MKGTVVSTWIMSSRKIFGDVIVNKAMEVNGYDKDYIFSPLEDVNDLKAKGMVEHIGKAVGKSNEEIWFIMGEENIATFSKAYPGFFRHESAYNFLKSMNDVHEIVVAKIAGSVPPKLDMEPFSTHEATFVYSSKREMGDYLIGLISGVAKYFNEVIVSEIIERNNTTVTINLKFETPIKYVKKYPLNQIFSLGGNIKRVSLKTAVFNTAVLTLLSFIMSIGIKRTVLIGATTFVISYLTDELFNKPMNHISYELSELGKRRFIEQSEIHSKDEYEIIMNEINKVKKAVQLDFIAFNSTVDEMHTFNKSLSTISTTMEAASGDIASVIDDVSHAAITQAEDTESAIYALDDSIKHVITVSDESENNREKIEAALLSIKESFNNVKSTAVEINTILDKFFEIKKSSDELKEKALNMTNIVSIVSKIAKQISLLALNASIEAARAGEAGRGFVVVSDEIKLLSEQTNDAVDDINKSLTEFALSIDNIGDNIDDQYNVLEEENAHLTQAIEMSSSSNDDLELVSDLMVQTSENLKNEANNISNIFDGIQGLAAIAEENSASTEEANSNVAIYLEEINKLTGQIAIFDDMIQEFQEGLSSYII